MPDAPSAPPEISANDFNPPKTARSYAAWLMRKRGKRIVVEGSNSAVARFVPANVRLKCLLWAYWPNDARGPDKGMLAQWNEYPLSAIKPKDLASSLVDQIRSLSDVWIWADDGNRLYWSVELGQRGHAHLMAARTVDIETSIAHHEVVRRWGAHDPMLDKENPKRWVALLNWNAVNLYRKLGVNKIVVDAGLQRGGYVWARWGWHPIDPREWRRVKRYVRTQYPKIKKILTTEDREAIESALVSDDPRVIERIVRVETKVGELRDGRVIRAGNHLLAGSRWTGVLDLTNASQVDVFAKLVRKTLNSYP